MDDIHFYCVFCGAGLDADAEHAGKLCECPGCLRLTPAPAATNVRPKEWAITYPLEVFSVDVKFPCSKCGARLGADAKSAGSPVYCPVCKSIIHCPSLLFLLEPQSQPAPAAKQDAPRTVIHLSRAEIEFLGAMESSPGKGTRHAS